MHGEQLKLLRFVLREETPTYEEVQKHMGYGQQELSGVLSGVTRNAKKVTGDKNAKVIDCEIQEDSKRHYYVKSEPLSFLKSLLEKT